MGDNSLQTYWILTTEYPPFHGGGISTYCFFSAKMLHKKGHVVTIFINDFSVKDVYVEVQEGVRIIRFRPSRTNFSETLGYITNLSYEFAFIVKEFIEKEGKPDLIEAQEYLGIAYYLLQFKHLQYEWCKDVPVLLTMHSPAFLYLEYNQALIHKYPNFWIGEMERFCIQAADVLISPSQFLLSEVGKRMEYHNPNLFVVPNPFEAVTVTGNSGTDQNQNEIVYLGKLSAQKGTFALLNYFKSLWDSGFSESLHLIGGQDIVYHPAGKTMGNLVKSQYREYIDKGLLIMEGQLLPSEIEKRLYKAKVVIVPSIVENFPYVVMEMMSLGHIVLVSKQGGQAEIVEDGVSGFIFDHENPNSFFQQFHRVLSLSISQRVTIGRKASERIQNAYNLDQVYGLKFKALEEGLAQKNTVKLFPFIRASKPQIKNTLGSAEVNGKLSVVIPFYNMGKFSDETIDSVRRTDLKLKEIIIVNDGSTDPLSIEKLNLYRKRDDIKIIDIPNQGLANARNVGAESANGEFLAFLDADDRVAPNYFRKALKVLTFFENVDFVGSWTKYFEGSEKVWPTFSPEPPLILYHNLINSSALVYKRQSFLAAGKNDKRMPFPGLEDYESVVSLVSKGFRGVVLPEVLFYYRVRGDSMIRGVSKEKKVLLHNYIGKKHQAFYSLYVSEIFSLINSNGPGIYLDNPSVDYNLELRFPFNYAISQKIISSVKKNRHLKKVALRVYNIFYK
ncbi:glycosyltransferase [Rufibacter roseolus]|uniref:glycosyltransferase n=1 Tax=Rufibacter roseolus TaxID=2817375 RepID=UPI001B311CFD|nr:glycosyltransferase [Rufibacter roseolus]